MSFGQTTRSIRRAAALLTMLPALAVVSALALQPALAQGDGTDGAVEGVIYDASGQPIPECRVVARAADGSEVFISEPSDNDGKYYVAVPSGRSYVIIALVSPTGARVELPAPAPLVVPRGAVTRDLRLPMPMAPSPRRAKKNLGGVDRLFFAFIEDPATAAHQRYEIQFGAADLDFADRYDVEVLAAFQPLPLLEIGIRGGQSEVKPDVGPDRSGAVDTDVWAKLHLMRTKDTKLDVSMGAVLTLPTGDDAEGLGQDALQSKIFLAMSYSLPSAALVGHLGVRAAENGRSAGIPLEGEVSATAGLGLVIPFTPRVSVVFEAFYDGERFDKTEADSSVLAGVNWRVGSRGRFRAAVAAGLEDTSADAEVLVGYAYAF